MPGGRCAAISEDQPFSGPDRKARLTARVGPVTRTLYLSGAATAFFPDRDDQQIRELAPGDQFRVAWEDAAFYGEDWLFGPLLVTLRPMSASPAAPSMVRSLAAETPLAPVQSFFPALSRNELLFTLHSSRLGAEFNSEKPVVNEARIEAIPPFGSVYKLVEPVEFRGATSSTLSRLVGDKIVIESCDVKLIVQGGMTVRLRLLRETDDTAFFEAVVTNETGLRSLRASWIVWPRPEFEVNGWTGSLRLGTSPAAFHFALPRDVLFRDRWLAVSVAQPFEVDAAAAVQFPALS